MSIYHKLLPNQPGKEKEKIAAKMGVVTVLSQFILLGLASAQIIKNPLIRAVKDLDAKFAAALPAPQKYSLETWPEEDSKYFTSPLLLSISFVPTLLLFLFCSSSPRNATG